MLALARDLGGRADWLFVYIAEAHATDEWPIASSRFNGTRGPVHLAQTRTLATRRAAAAAFARDFGLLNSGSGTVGAKRAAAAAAAVKVTVALDDPERGEPFSQAFAPWPVRMFVLQKGTRRSNNDMNGGGKRISRTSTHEGYSAVAAAASMSAATRAAAEEPAQVRFLSAPRNSGFIDLEPFADALRYAAADPL